MGQMATKAKLEVLSGDTFDKSYIKGMIRDHEEDIAMFKKEAASGKDPRPSWKHAARKSGRY
jgi:putative membrane protein